MMARWDGSRWHAIEGITFHTTPLDLASDGQNLYLYSQSFSLDGVVRNGVAKWDGASWTFLGTGGGAPLVVYGQQLFAGGAAGVPLARYNGAFWSRIGIESGWSYNLDGNEIFPRVVNSLVLRGDHLYFGGSFTKANGVAAEHVGHFDATPRTYDEWRDIHFSPAERFTSGMADADADGDGVTNADEFAAGSDPRNGESVFELTHVVFPVSAANGPGEIQGTYARILLRFEAKAHKSYTVQYRNALTEPWQIIRHLPARDVDRTVTVFDDDHAAAFRVYRVVTPAIP